MEISVVSFGNWHVPLLADDEPNNKLNEHGNLNAMMMSIATGIDLAKSNIAVPFVNAG